MTAESTARGGAPELLVRRLANADPTASPEIVAEAADRYAALGRRICAEASALIRRHGHCQGRLGDRDDGYCITGALRLAAAGGDAKGRTWAQLLRRPHAEFGAACILVRARLGLIDGSDLSEDLLAGWNDEAGRTAWEVLEVLDDVAGEREPR